MTLPYWRRTLLAGCLAVAIPAHAWAQAPAITLEQALARAGLAQPDPGSAPPINPRIEASQADIAAAEAMVRQAGARPNPELGIEAENVAGTGPYSGMRGGEYTVSLSLPIEWGGKRGARLRAAEADLDVVRLRGSLAMADLGYLVRSRYVEVVAAEARADIARDIWERNRELARIAQTLVDVGREPPQRAMRAQAALAEAEADLKAAMAGSLAARFALGALWGADTAPATGTTFPDIRPPHDLLDQYSGIAPRLAGAETGAARADIAQQRALGVSDPTFQAGVRRIEESNDQALLVGVSIPLPFGNRNRGAIAAAEARSRAAEAREAVARADYRQEVAATRADYLAAEAKADALAARSVPQAEEALRLTQIGYRHGKFPLIEVLSAAEARDGLRRSLIDARAQQARTAAMLIRLAQP